MPKKCTLAIGRSVYVRKQCDGMTLKAADEIIRGLAEEVYGRLLELLPADVSLDKPREPRLLTRGTVEVGISSAKDGKSYPTYLWVDTEAVKELEKEYRISMSIQ